jgi:hypothetical protein
VVEPSAPRVVVSVSRISACNEELEEVPAVPLGAGFGIETVESILTGAVVDPLAGSDVLQHEVSSLTVAVFVVVVYGAAVAAGVLRGAFCSR